jgi:ferredoxin
MKIDPKKCPQNHPCPAIKVCPVEAISQKGFGLPIIDEEKCINCGECINFCPMGAFSE